MLNDAQDLNEYAFALGALSHYISDINGHPYINLSVGIEYPELARLYGPAVPYDVDHKAHCAPSSALMFYRSPRAAMRRRIITTSSGLRSLLLCWSGPFYDTYGLKLTDVMPNEQLAIGTYRRSVSEIIPEMTKVALLVKGDELKREIPNFNRQHFLYHLSKADYNKSWGSGYQNPGPGAHFLAVLFKVAPKVGPLRAIDFKEPTPKTEDLYFKSVDQTIDRFGKALSEVKNRSLQTPNIDLDTGKPTQRGEYPLADVTYRELLDELAYDHFNHMDDALRNNILEFYEGFGLPKPGTRIDKCVVQRWQKTWIELTQLRASELLGPLPRIQPPPSAQVSMLPPDSDTDSCVE